MTAAVSTARAQPTWRHALVAARSLATREALVLTVVAIYAALIARLLPGVLLQDGWLTLVAGREVAESGLPTRDGLAVLTAGDEWVDQQWLAQLVFYGLAVAGGVKLVLLAHLGLLVGGFALALAAARALGGSPASVAVVGAVAMLVAPWSLQLRAQTLALPLFVVVLWLLAADSRNPSRRVYLVLPLLAIWGNVHGTVVVGAALVVLHGVLRGLEAIRQRAPRRRSVVAMLLALFAPMCVLASPYGLELIPYYETMLFESTLREYVNEWRVSTPSASTVPFYALAFAGAWLVGRAGRTLTLFERATLVLLLLGAITTIRSIVWFGLAALLLLPRLLDAARGRRTLAAAAMPPRAAFAFAAVVVTATVASFAFAATRADGWFVRDWPSASATRVAQLVRERPGAVVFSDERFADWLLWEQPELRGRIAHDARLELLDERQLSSLRAYYGRAPGWRGVVSPYEIVVVDTAGRRGLADALEENGFTTAHRAGRISVLVRR